IHLLNGRFQVKENKLTYHFSDQNEAEIDQIGKKMIAKFDRQLEKLNKEKVTLEGKIPSTERIEKLSELNARISSLTKLRNRMISGLAEGIKIRQKEAQYK